MIVSVVFFSLSQEVCQNLAIALPFCTFNVLFSKWKCKIIPTN